ncbi:hypothetical protein LL037_09445 [Clostridium estertheticum]|uniref:Uncharacterized protein n=1 Tax=Clostridium estertheticum TaxID=238834 RepID=A0AA47EGN5_9CLOT|nr:hypothetical protein [Clostridium estertheticum]MBU3156187.1 hypothetical protein [Clostridium estertheticum]MBU3199420.1 hypothetical protein [Clostridium estertheticum]WAG58626.1 hypothetical protein LL038_13245 [Clostridium estertheticum]WAG67336.1 hypothetical protein LL037_09445 [Clostridium estertheticum]
MEHNVKKASKKSAISITLFISAIVVAILGVVLLVVNIYLYRTSVNQAVAQGYAVATVRKAYVPSQLIPGIFQPIALYGGVALILLAVGKISDKVSKCLAVLTEKEICDDVTYENCEDQVDQDVVNEENIETTNPEEILDETQKNID